MEGDKTDHHEVIPISFNFHSLLTGHCYTFFKLPIETYTVVTRSQTEAVETQLPKVHGADKVVHQALKPETQARREGIPKSIPVIPKSVSQAKRIIPPVLPRKGQGRVGASRKTIRPKLQIIPPPSTVIPMIGGRPPPIQSIYKLPLCKDPLHLPSPPKPPDRPIDAVTQHISHQRLNMSQ